MCKQDPQVCDFCQAGHRCGGLKQALVMLDAESRPKSPFREESQKRAVYDRFRLGVEAYGFQYGQTAQPCWLSDKPSVVNRLIEEAIDLLGEFRASDQKSA